MKYGHIKQIVGRWIQLQHVNPLNLPVNGNNHIEHTICRQLVLQEDVAGIYHNWSNVQKTKYSICFCILEFSDKSLTAEIPTCPSLIRHRTDTQSQSTSLHKKATIYQITTTIATSRNVLIPGHNHLLTPGTDDRTL